MGQLSIKNEKGGADKIDQTSNGRVRSRSSNVEEKVSHMRGSWGNSRHSYLSPSLPSLSSRFVGRRKCMAAWEKVKLRRRTVVRRKRELAIRSTQKTIDPCRDKMKH